ncbi:MAG TPA: Uma2 family endonuclease [Leptolyngbyaceae cyanobacterium]
MPTTTRFGGHCPTLEVHKSNTRDRQEIDLDRDLPPDLMLEVDFSNSSLNKLPIYTALGVPEIWRYAQGNLQIY